MMSSPILIQLKKSKILDTGSNLLAVSFKNKNKTNYFSTRETSFGEVIRAPGYKSLKFPHVGLTNV